MQSGKWKTGSGKPVVALDIDGTLGDYHSHFLWFAEKYTDRPMPYAHTINPGLPLYRHMHVSKRLYQDIKLAYRQGGMKRWMPCYSGAQGLTRSLRHNGIEVWICTTRPYLRLDNIDPDTREWLRRNRIQYDAVLFGDRKYADLVRQVGRDRIIAAADDLPEQIDLAYKAGIANVYMRNQPYNRNFQAPHRFHDLKQLGDWILDGRSRTVL